MAKIHFLPWVLLWDPSTQTPFVKVGLECPVCHCKVIKKTWRTGYTQGKDPRILYSFDKAILLLGATYLCQNKHETISYDPRISAYYKSKSSLPFILGHRCGFTREFFNNLVSHLSQGISFQGLEQLIRNSHKTFFVNYEMRFWATLQTTYAINAKDNVAARAAAGKCIATVENLINEAYNIIALRNPGRHVLHDGFLQWFFENEEYYVQQIADTTVDECISFDHTFKLASNIGYWRPDGKWVPQYDSVCFVMNENGQVITWRFTRQTSFEQISPNLSQLKERLKQQGKEIKIVAIDNCCQLRQKIQQVFGPQVRVTLDLFHATARIIRTLRKGHTHCHHCLADLRNVFRADDDLNKQRMKATPTSTEIIKKLESFSCKWEGVEGLFTEKTSVELNSLSNHIRKGCLSGIQPTSWYKSK